jgi:hypothetical protein
MNRRLDTDPLEEASRGRPLPLTKPVYLLQLIDYQCFSKPISAPCLATAGVV